MLKMWDGLRQRADADQDGQVRNYILLDMEQSYSRCSITFFIYALQISREEWYSLWEEYAKDPSNPSDWQDTYMNLSFQLFDASGKLVKPSIFQNDERNIGRYCIDMVFSR